MKLHVPLFTCLALFLLLGCNEPPGEVEHIDSTAHEETHAAVDTLRAALPDTASPAPATPIEEAVTPPMRAASSCATADPGVLDSLTQLYEQHRRHQLAVELPLSDTTVAPGTTLALAPRLVNESERPVKIFHDEPLMLVHLLKNGARVYPGVDIHFNAVMVMHTLAPGARYNPDSAWEVPLEENGCYRAYAYATQLSIGSFSREGVQIFSKPVEIEVR